MTADAHPAADETSVVGPPVPCGSPGDESPGDEAVVRPALPALVEAILMVAENPVPVTEIAVSLDVPAADVERVIAGLARDYIAQGRGFSLRDIGGGWRFYTSEECAPWVERFVLAGQNPKLSQAALETLAVVAYQQPVSRGRISAVRGVSADGVIRTLTTRRLVEEAGTDPETGATLYRTTDYFLERMGLRHLDELPPLAPLLPDIADVDDIVGS
ncbi:SMC-Scp complex subunit ScpB [Frankia sp. Cr2]|uniref:SMC-Scp complex subunit ScpB n=1 Tax=Frankia sp. Cr2 TaxID=3073932 RepID=UPI003A101967